MTLPIDQAGTASDVATRAPTSTEDRACLHRQLDEALIESIRRADGISLHALCLEHGPLALQHVANVARAQLLIDRRLQVLRNQGQIHCITSLWHIGSMPGSSRDSTPDPDHPADLSRLCEELLEWLKSGTLSESSAFRAYAASAVFDGDEDSRLQRAERRIELAALQYVADQRGRALPGEVPLN